MQRIDLAQVAPDAFKAVFNLDQYVTANVESGILELIKLRASILNGCAYCVDSHSRKALAAGESDRRLFALAAWRESPFFDERERAALALTDAITRLGEHGVPDDVWDAAAQIWSEKELADLVTAIATINVWNRLAVSTRIQPPALA